MGGCKLNSYKWSLIFLLTFFPLFLLLAEILGQSITATDADTAARSAAQASLKANVVPDSLRDADVYPDNHVVQFNAETIQDIFDRSVSRRVMEDSNGKGYIAVAMEEGVPGTKIRAVPAPFPDILGFQPGGRGNSPPMIAIRTNVVRRSIMYDYMSNFAPIFSEFINVQNQKIAVLEVK
jgi:hypothetical protein